MNVWRMTKSNYLCARIIEYDMTEKNRIEYKNMKIPLLTKKRMDFLKGKQTYGEFLDCVLGYFEMTGVDPKYNQLPPAISIVKAFKEECAVLYKRIEDGIKISRNIETNKIDTIIHGIDALLKGKSSADSDSSGIGPEDEDVIKIIKVNELLEAQVREKQKAIDEFKNRINNINGGHSQRIMELAVTVEELLGDKVLPKHGDQNFILSKEHRQQLFEKIRSLANVQ